MSLASRLGCTEGQVYTIVTGLVLAGLLGMAGRSDVSVAAEQPSNSGVITPPTAGTTAPAPVIVPTPGLTPPALGGIPLPAPSFQPQPTVDPLPSDEPGPPAGPAVFAMLRRPGAPSGIAVTRIGDVIVSTGNGTSAGESGPSKVLQYDPSGRLVATITVQGQPSSHTNGLGAVAINPADDSVYVADIDTSRILRLDLRTRSQTTVTTIPDTGPCLLSPTATPCEPGVVDHKPLVSGLAFDDAGNLFAADAGQATIWRIRPGRPAEAWYQSLDLATGDGPAGLDIGSTGSLSFTAGSTLDTSAPNAGALYSLSRNADGSAGARTLIASFPSGDRPGAVTEDISGTAYVVLRGTGTIVSVASGQVQPFSTQGSPVPLDHPAGLVSGNGRLLVTNQGGATASRWAVLSFPLG